MDKLATAVNRTRLNWWDAFKKGINIKGYEYYKPPGEIKYRYPAPGSCPIDDEDHPYNEHYKTPFKASHYNIRDKKKVVISEEEAKFNAFIGTFDPNDYLTQAYEDQPITVFEERKELFEPVNKSIEE